MLEVEDEHRLNSITSSWIWEQCGKIKGRRRDKEEKSHHKFSLEGKKIVQIERPKVVFSTLNLQVFISFIKVLKENNSYKGFIERHSHVILKSFFLGIVTISVFEKFPFSNSSSSLIIDFIGNSYTCLTVDESHKGFHKTFIQHSELLIIWVTRRQWLGYL